MSTDSNFQTLLFLWLNSIRFPVSLFIVCKRGRCDHWLLKKHSDSMTQSLLRSKLSSIIRLYLKTCYTCRRYPQTNRTIKNQQELLTVLLFTDNQSRSSIDRSPSADTETAEKQNRLLAKSNLHISFIQPKENNLEHFFSIISIKSLRTPTHSSCIQIPEPWKGSEITKRESQSMNVREFTLLLIAITILSLAPSIFSSHMQRVMHNA